MGTKIRPTVLPTLPRWDILMAGDGTPLSSVPDAYNGGRTRVPVTRRHLSCHPQTHPPALPHISVWPPQGLFPWRHYWNLDILLGVRPTAGSLKWSFVHLGAPRYSPYQATS